MSVTTWISRLGELGHPVSSWLALALLAELASLLAYTGLMRELLRLGGVAAPVRPLLRAAVGAIALGASLPGGQAVSAAWWYRRLRCHGANGRLAATAIAGAMLAGGLSLGALVVAGVALAGDEGPLASIRVPLLGVAGALVAVAFATRRRLPRLSARLTGRLAPTRRGLLAIASLALANWLLDCASLWAALAAVGASVPPQSVLLTYALAQLVASVPVLPGGGGTVEASLTLAFGTFAGTSGNVLAGVLLFRVISCWGLIPLGWLGVVVDGRSAMSPMRLRGLSLTLRRRWLPRPQPAR